MVQRKTTRRKPRRTKGRQPRVNKTSRRVIPAATRAFITGLEDGGYSYTKIRKATGVATSTAKNIVQRARAHAAEHNLPLCAPENYHDDNSHKGHPRVRPVDADNKQRNAGEEK